MTWSDCEGAWAKLVTELSANDYNMVTLDGVRFKKESVEVCGLRIADRTLDKMALMRYIEVKTKYDYRVVACGDANEGDRIVRVML